MRTVPEIKICGLRDLKDIEIVNKYDVSYAGFIMAKSKRKVSMEDAKKMRSNLNPDIKAVGVFTNMVIGEINEISEYIGFDIIQLHSDETDDDCKKAILPVWKAISIKDEYSVVAADKYLNASGILFDTYNKKMYGGSGSVFNWDYIKDHSKHKFTILAGGLTPENINDAIKSVTPNVLDINSGVETDGRKDETRIRELFRRVKNGIR